MYSESYRDILKEAGVRILISYATTRRRRNIGEYDSFYAKLPYGFNEILIDSSAYQLQMNVKTAMNINIHEYSTWLHTALEEHSEISGYFNLDILGDGLKTLDHQFRMEKEYGLKPIPVWHAGEEEHFLQFYYENYEYISVGGLVSASAGKQALRNLVGLLHQKYPNCKYHFFGIGITATSIFSEWRPYSVDFSTWSNAARFGSHIVIDPKQLLKEVALPLEIKKQMLKYKIKCPIDDCGYEDEFSFEMIAHLVTQHKMDRDLAKEKVHKIKKNLKSAEERQIAEKTVHRHLRESVEVFKTLEETIETIHSPNHQLLMI